MKTNNRIIILSFLSIGIFFNFFSCDDIFEDDISSKDVALIAPSNGVISKIVEQTFWWEEVEGAKAYNIQVVTPTFASIEGVILDSITNNNKFNHIFSPGIYEWTVTAWNTSSQAESEIFSFEIIENDISSIAFSLLSPPNNTTSDTVAQTFWWEKVEGAEEYNIQIVSPSFSNIEKLVLDTVFTDNKLNYTLDNGNIYQWRVIATNLTSQTESEIYTITIDTSTKSEKKNNLTASLFDNVGINPEEPKEKK
jgi:hypothetical protein